MTKRPTFKESWLTGEIPGHPIVGGALYNAVLHAREVLAGQQEKTIRKLWDILNTVLEKRRSHQEPTPFSLRGRLFASLVGEGGSYELFLRLRFDKDPDIQRILNEVPEEKVLATLILAEVDHSHVYAAIEAASELDPIQKNIIFAEIGSADSTYIARDIADALLELEKQTKTIVPKEMGRKGGSRRKKRREDVVKHAIRRVSEKIDSTESREVFNAFADADLMADLRESLSDPVRLTVMGVDYEKKEIRYRRLSDGKDGKFTFKTLQNHLSEIRSR